MKEQWELWHEAQTHVICDFLSQVGLRDKDLGDFLTGSIKHTSHQWVFTVLQSRSLYKATVKEKNSSYAWKWKQNSRTEVLTHLQTHVPYKGETLLTYSPPWEKQIQMIHTDIYFFDFFIKRHMEWDQYMLFTLNLCSSRLRTCPVVMELFTRTLVTEP